MAVLVGEVLVEVAAAEAGKKNIDNKHPGFYRPFFFVLPPLLLLKFLLANVLLSLQKALWSSSLCHSLVQHTCVELSFTSGIVVYKYLIHGITAGIILNVEIRRALSLRCRSDKKFKDPHRYMVQGNINPFYLKGLMTTSYLQR